jgi:hypothetical protein
MSSGSRPPRQTHTLRHPESPVAAGDPISLRLHEFRKFIPECAPCLGKPDCYYNPSPVRRPRYGFSKLQP